MHQAILILYIRISQILKNFGLHNFYPFKTIICLILPLLRVHEPLETVLVAKILKPGDVAIDIGAHVGYYTLLFAKLVGEDGHVFAFEPDPINFSLLKKNVKPNYQNVTLIPRAVSNKTGKLLLYFEENRAKSTIFRLSGYSKFIEVESITLNDYFQSLGKFPSINFIKMDIEGAEYLAFQGMGKIIQKNTKILMEFAPTLLKNIGVDPEEFLQYITALGFQIYQITEKGLSLANFADLVKIYPHSNIFLKRKNKSKEIINRE